MDPDATLEELLEISESTIKLSESEKFPDIEPTEVELFACRSAELVQALDEWIRKGGFLPRRWREPFPVEEKDDELQACSFDDPAIR